nr:FAD-dependent oxidoreductase [Rhizobiaceae bacterium]
MTAKQKLVVIGNGMAPGRMLEDLIEKDGDAFEITIFNAEPHVNYNRLMLSPVLSGEKIYEDIITHDDDWYAERKITLHKSSAISNIDREAKIVTSYNGIECSYDKLVIATGSDPFIIPLPGKDLDGVLTYRDLDDVETMIEVSKSGGHAVVI